MNFGENDFMQYWTAFQLHLNGLDYFDPQVTFELQKKLGWKELRPLVTMNPPWILALLSPILFFDFFLSAKLFLVLNVILLLLSLYLLTKIYVPSSSRKNNFLFLIFPLFFFPLLLCLKLGQVSIIITFAMSLLLYSIKKSNSFLIALAFVLLSVKPQLMFLPVLLSLFYIKDKGEVILNFLIMLFILNVILFAGNSNTLTNWIDRSQYHQSPLLVDFKFWKTTTLSTLIRDIVFNLKGSFVFWPMYVVPALTILLLFFSKIYKKINFENLFAILIPISCFTSPFGWIYDASTVLVTQIWIFSKKLSKLRFTLLILLQLSLFFHFIYFKTGYYNYWYFYPLYLLIILFRNKNLNNLEAELVRK